MLKKVHIACNCCEAEGARGAVKVKSKQKLYLPRAQDASALMVLATMQQSLRVQQAPSRLFGSPLSAPQAAVRSPATTGSALQQNSNRTQPKVTEVTSDPVREGPTAVGLCQRLKAAVFDLHFARQVCHSMKKSLSRVLSCDLTRTAPAVLALANLLCNIYAGCKVLVWQEQAGNLYQCHPVKASHII